MFAEDRGKKNKKIVQIAISAKQRAQIMLDTMPLSCNFWDKDYNLIDCSQATVDLFRLSCKQEFMDRFFELSPLFQPDSSPSREKATAHLKEAYEKGRAHFEWMHRALDGEAIPSEVTLIRVEYGNSNLIVGYVVDQRELKASIAEACEAEERTKIMLDATPLCCNFWDENFRNIDCNQEAVNLFDLSCKQEYLDRFFELSPERQLDGRLSSEKAFEKISEAFKNGRSRFEWMHQKLNGDPIPAEVTLVRVKRGQGYVVASYTRDLRELKETVALLNHLERLAFTDALTGIFNRRHFMEKAQKAFLDFSNNASHLSIIMMDLDWFKKVNDTYGHAAGDELLKAVTREAQSALRTSDLAARYGGEEFIFLAFDANRETAIKLAERIRKKITEFEFEFGGNTISVTASLGVATKSDLSATLEETIQLADKALYKAKANGRDRVEIL